MPFHKLITSNVNKPLLNLPLGANTTGKIRGSVTTTNPSDKWVKDFEGIYRKFYGNTGNNPAFEGTRIVTNLLLNSDTPATQTVTLSIGTYLLWMVGSGYTDVAAGTASGSYFSTALSGENDWTTFEITSPGTVIITPSLSGTVTKFQLENITSQTFQEPSEYVSTTSTPRSICFDTAFVLGRVPNDNIHMLLPLGSEINGKIRGGLNATCSSVRYINDHEGILRYVAPNCPAFPGARNVTNLLLNSDNITASNWGINNLSGNITRTPNTLTFGADGRDGLLAITQKYLAVGDVIISSIVLSGTGSVFFYGLNGIGNPISSITVTLTTIPTRYFIMNVNNVAGINNGLFISNFSDELAKTITIKNAQVENITSQSIQFNGEYIPTTSAAVTKFFDYTLPAPNIIQDNNLATNNGFWIKDMAITIAGNGIAVWDISVPYAALYRVAYIPTIAIRYRVTFTVNSLTSGSGFYASIGGTAGTLRSVPGTYTEDIVSGVNGNIAIAAVGVVVGSVSGISIKNIHLTGQTDSVPLRPFYFPQGVKKYKVYEESPRTRTFITGQSVEAISSDGLRRVYTCNVSGTTSGSAITWPTTGTVVDNTVTWSTTGLCTILGLLHEPAATNIILQSGDFSNATWTKTGVKAPVQTTAPDGTNNAWLLSEDATTGVHDFGQQVVVPSVSSPYGWSVYVKNIAGSRNVEILLADTSGASAYVYAIINPSTGAIVTNITASAMTSPGLTVTPCANGYCRIFVTGVYATSNRFVLIRLINGVTFSYTGDNTSSVAVAFGQLEATAYATSPIITTTGTVTRAATTASFSSVNNITASTSLLMLVDAFPYNTTGYHVICGPTGQTFTTIQQELSTNGNVTLTSITNGSSSYTSLIGSVAVPMKFLRLASRVIEETKELCLFCNSNKATPSTWVGTRSIITTTYIGNDALSAYPFLGTTLNFRILKSVNRLTDTAGITETTFDV